MIKMVNAKALAWKNWFKSKMCNSDTCPTDSTMRTYGYNMNWLESRLEGFDLEKELTPDPETVLEYMVHFGLCCRPPQDASRDAESASWLETSIERWPI